MLNNIIQLHINHDYYIKVKPIPNMPGCIVDFPNNLINQKPKLTRTYLINEPDSTIELYHKENGQELVSKNIKTIKPGIRLLIMSDILLKAINRGMSRKLIIVDPPEKNMFQLLEMNMNKEELALERELCVNFRELLLGKDSKNVKTEVKECYYQIVECFENGGF